MTRVKTKTRTMTHEFDGRKYEQASAHQREWGAKLIAELGLRGDEAVLDLGCGDGGLTERIADLVPDGEVLGIDASRGMIETAGPRSRANLSFLLMDIDEIDFDDRFDLVFSNAAPHWIKDHRRLLRNVRRALRAGGSARFNFGAEGNCATFFRVIREAMARPEFSAHFAAFEWPWTMPAVDAYLEIARSSGLREVRVWGENADRYFPDEGALIRWIDQPSLVPFLPRVADRDREAFRSYVIRRMVDETRQTDGTCFETFRRINLSAAK